MQIGYWAVPAAAVAAWIFGAAWYGLLGKVWTRAQGIDPGASAGAGATKNGASAGAGATKDGASAGAGATKDGASAGAGATKNDACKDKKMPLWPMLGSFGAELLMALALRHVLARLELFRWNEGLFTGVMIGVFFVATTILVNNLFQGRKLMLSVIDGLHWIFVLAIEGLVLTLLA